MATPQTATGHCSSEFTESTPLLPPSEESMLEREMTSEHLECLKLAASYALNTPFDAFSKMKSYAEIRGLITATPDEIEYYIKKMIENQLPHNLPPMPPSRTHPKFDMILTLGKMIISMEEADYNKFRRLIACRIHINPDNIKPRDNLIKRLCDEYPGFENGDPHSSLEKPLHLYNVYNWLNECDCYKYRKYLEEYSDRHSLTIPKKGIGPCYL